MKKYFVVLAALLLCGGARAASAPASAGKAAGRAGTVAAKFHRKAASRHGNIFFSPYSMYSAFAMVYEGARGQTASEMSRVFGFPAERGDLRLDFSLLRDELAKSAGSSEFSQANAFWYQKDYKFLPEYQEALGSRYAASAEASDFKKDPEAVRLAVNSWTDKQTKGKIKDLFAKGSFRQGMRLVLVNAVYFKGKWKEQFRKQDTWEQEFTLPSGSRIKTPLMESPGYIKVRYSKTDSFQAAALPYAGGDLEMLVILPGPGEILSEIEKTLTEQKIAAIRSGLRGEEVKVFLPRFRFSDDWDLGPELSALGMPLAFTFPGADFSGMDGKKDLFVQKAVQKAFIEVNEEGAEAAAATGVAMMPGSAAGKRQPVVFRADRPFIFIIEDSRTGLILFMGRLADPR